MISRRGFFGGLAATLAAPAIVRSGILMPVRVIAPPRLSGPDEFLIPYFDAPLNVGDIITFGSAQVRGLFRITSITAGRDNELLFPA